MILEALVLYIYIYIYNSRYKNATSKFCCIFLRSWFHISVPDSLLLACQATRSYTINSLKLKPPPPKKCPGAHSSCWKVLATNYTLPNDDHNHHDGGFSHSWVSAWMGGHTNGRWIHPHHKSISKVWSHTLQLSHHDHDHQQNQRLQLIHI
jgi:hypothetical protein